MTLAKEEKFTAKYNTKKVCYCKWIVAKDEPDKLIAQWICEDILVGQIN